MITTAFWWLFFNLITIIILAFYSMSEMACVSFNKIRLHYYVAKGIKPAIWLNTLLQHPSRLFGTTLFGVNIAMTAGSECSREFHIALGLSPDLAPLSQVLIVVVLGELAPMFAARHYAEHVGLLTAPLLYASSKIMAPLLWIVEIISDCCHWIIGGKDIKPDIFLSQEELQKILEEQDEDAVQNANEELNQVSANIFNLRSKDAKKVMLPIKDIPMLPSNANVLQMRHLLKKTRANYIPIYHRDRTNIIGIAFPRDFVRIAETQRVRDHARPPWFVTQQTKIIPILKQFRYNNQNVAVILDREGYAVGVILLEDLLEEIFGKSRRSKKMKNLVIIDKTFPGDMSVADFNQQFDTMLHEKDDLSLSQLMTHILDHHPAKGESIYLAPYELTVKEASLLEAKAIAIKTRAP